MATEQQIHAAHQSGYDANYDGALIGANPHATGSDEHRAWEAGHLQAASVRREWEECNGTAARMYGEAA